MADYNKFLQVSKKLENHVFIRDRGCIYCAINYHMHPNYPNEPRCMKLDPMHYMPKGGRLGLGIPENIVSGCRYHHELCDNGNKGLREEMLKIARKYLKSIYPEWEKKILVYSKGRKAEIEEEWKQWK